MKEIQKCSKERKKQLIIDLCVIAAVSFVILGVLAFLGNSMNGFAYDSSINIAIRVAIIGICAQFGILGLGITIVCLVRKEKFTQFGLTTKNLIPALLLSIGCCVPDFIYRLYRGSVHAWCPFWDVNTTPEVITLSFGIRLVNCVLQNIASGTGELLYVL